MLRCLVAGLFILLSIATSCLAVEVNLTPAQTTPLGLAAVVERRAQSSSFDSLEQFAQNSLSLTGHERLARLHYAAYIFSNQSEYARAARWHRKLIEIAQSEQNQRYAEVGQIDLLYDEYAKNGAPAAAKLEQWIAKGSDWYVKTHAMVLRSSIYIDEGKIGENLKILVEARAMAPANDPDHDAALSDIWELTGLALAAMHDLEGASRALATADIGYRDPSYPHPDFDSLYSMTKLAALVGQTDLSRQLWTIHHRLVLRANRGPLSVWDANLCTIVREPLGHPKDILACTASLSRDLHEAVFLAPPLLTARAIAEARTGRLTEAREDLDRLEALQAQGRFAATQFERLKLIEAEILAAQGQEKAAYTKLREFHDEQAMSHANQFDDAAHQITRQLQAELEDVQHAAKLKQRVIYIQWGMGVLAGLVAVAAIAGVFWQRRLAIRFREAQTRADAANHAKSEFLANISHEIRTPLNGILGMAQAVMGDDLPQVQRGRVEVIQQSGQALLTILNDLLDLSKIEAGMLELEVVPFRIEPIVEGVQQLFEPIAAAKGLEFAVVKDPSIADPMLGDPTRVRQVLYNLVSNAIKFTERGGVSVRLWRTDAGLMVAVRDTGVGMSDEVMGRIFGKFEQADSSTTRKFGGTGLGLAITRQLVEAMGGRIDVQSEVGKGSSFEILLDLAPTSMEPTVPGRDAGLASITARTNSEPVKILAAEDNKINQLVLRTLLAPLECELTVVSNGREAVEAFRREAWNVVLMDIQMPEMDGKAALNEIRRIERGDGRSWTPIVALTANTMAHHVQEYLALGFDSHLAKPLDPTDLFRAIAEALEHKTPAPEPVS
jgi:signal transduction histidine kinase/ActR/RegA family two-component response regulator